MWNCHDMEGMWKFGSGRMDKHPRIVNENRTEMLSMLAKHKGLETEDMRRWKGYTVVQQWQKSSWLTRGSSHQVADLALLL